MIRFCQDSCRRRQFASDGGTGRFGLGSPRQLQLAPAVGSSLATLGAADAGAAGPRGHIDVSGAIAQGPPLSEEGGEDHGHQVSPVLLQMFWGTEPSPSADVRERTSPVLVQMWQIEPSSGADVGGASPVPV